MYYLYLITNKINEKVYVGKAKSPKKRWQKHIRPDVRTLKHQAIAKAIRKYGKDNFIFELVQAVDSEQEAFELEKFWIAELRRYSIPNYNLTDGGEGTSGYRHTQETKNNLSQMKLGIPFSEEHKQNLSAAKIGLPPPNKGKAMSNEQRSKLSEAHTGKILSEEHKQTIIKNAETNPNFGFKGRKHTEITKQKISESKTGTVILQSTKDKMSIARSLYMVENREKLFDKRTKIVWPDNLELLNVVKEFGYSEIGRRLGVSGNTIKGRLKRRGLI
jgi:group I intron endonuclease